MEISIHGCLGALGHHSMEPVLRRSGPWRYTSCTTSYSNGSRWTWWPSMQPSVQQRLDVFPINKWEVPSKTPENHQKIWFRCSWFWTSEWLSVWCYMFFCLERMVVLPMKIVVLGPQLEFLSWRFSTSSSDCCKPNAINLLFAGGWFENNPLLVGWGWSMAACDMCWFQLSKNPKMEDNHPSRVGSA